MFSFAGLLAIAGLFLGGHLIEPHDENAKGYFEKTTVIWENDAMLKHQDTHWSDNDIVFRPAEVVDQIMRGNLDFSRGRAEIAELEGGSPWVSQLLTLQ